MALDLSKLATSQEMQDRMAAIKKQFLEKKQQFLDRGAIVLSSILTEEEVAVVREKFILFVEESTVKKPEHPLRDPKRPETWGFKYDDPATYLDHNYLVALHGIIKNYQVGWAEFMWILRTHPCIIYVFALIHGKDTLISSLDGACFIPKRNLTQKNRKSGIKPSEKKSWLHKDVHPEYEGLFAVQSQVVISPEGKHLRFVPGSHKKDYSHMIKPDEKTGKYPPVKHWFKPPEGTPGFRLEDSELIEAEPGDMILWFSNTTHSGSMQQDERMVAYICYHPVDHLTARDLKRFKDNIVPKRRTCNHWTHGPSCMNGEFPQTYGLPQNDASLLEPRSDAYTTWKSTATATQIERSEIMTCQRAGHLLEEFDFQETEPIFKILSLEEGDRQLKASRKAKAENNSIVKAFAVAASSSSDGKKEDDTPVEKKEKARTHSEAVSVPQCQHLECENDGSFQGHNADGDFVSLCYKHGSSVFGTSTTMVYASASASASPSASKKARTEIDLTC